MKNRMNKLGKLLLIGVILTLIIFSSHKVEANNILVETISSNDNQLLNSTNYAILIEAKTGKILYEKNAHVKLPPASITKVMSIKLFFDALKSKRISNEQIITTSNYASQMGGSQIYLAPGEKMTVSDLLKAVIIASGNDATVALAETVSGSEAFFVKAMNEEVKKLGLSNTNFVNATGLPVTNHYTTCYDMAMIARSLVNSHEKEVLPISSTYEYYLRQDTDKPFWLVNTNKLIKYVEGLDGLKTGWTTEAGYCLVSTMKKGDMRLISVVMHVNSSEERNSDTVSLLNYGFANFEKVIIKPKGEVVATDTDLLTTPSEYHYITNDDIVYIKSLNNGELGEITHEIIIDKNKINNYYKDDIGVIKTYIDKILIDETKLSLEETITKPNFWVFINELLKRIF